MVTDTRRPSPPRPDQAEFDPREYARRQHWVADQVGSVAHEQITPSGTTDLDQHVRFLRWVDESDDVETHPDGSVKFRQLDQYRYWTSRHPRLPLFPDLPFFCVLNRRLVPEPGEGRPRARTSTPPP